MRAREARMPFALGEHWRRKDWEPFSPEEFYVTWGGLWSYARRLLVCTVRGHLWYDSHFILYGEPDTIKSCDRCWRMEALSESDDVELSE